MRLWLLLTIVAGVGVIAAPAIAVDYPWCAIFGSDFGGSTNCGFVTVDQCKASVSGIGGFCMPNNLYQPPVAAPSLSRRKRHLHKAS